MTEKKECKNFMGKGIKITELKLIANDPNPARPTEIYKMVLEVGKEWGEDYDHGQFVMIRIDEKGERIPLTVTEYDSKSLTLVFQVVGASTRKLAQLKAGDCVEDLTRPLGTPLKIPAPEGKKKKALVVAGGVGTAPAYAKILALKELGYETISLVGTRTKKILFMVDEIRKASDKTIITTDDGSYTKEDAAFYGDGSNKPDDYKLMGTHVLDSMIDYDGKQKDVKEVNGLHNTIKAEEIGAIFVVGPAIMMKFVSLLTKKMGIKTYASLNTTMVDGSAMCGACQVTLTQEDGTKIRQHSCKEGPIFDAHMLDWDEILTKGNEFCDQERLSRIMLDKSDDPLKDPFFLKLAKSLGIEDPKSTDEVIKAMEKRFSHKAGYLPLKEVVNVTSVHCLCKPGIKTKCQSNCPVDIDVAGFIQYLKKDAMEKAIGEGKEYDLEKVENSPEDIDPKVVEAIDHQIYNAYKTITNSNPIPEITGLVCPQETQCQQTCIRGIKGEPTQIGKIEAFVAHWIRKNFDRVTKYSWYEKPKVAPPTGKKVMIIGSGPGGLVAAAALAKLGHDVTVYELLHDAGGVLLYGIPEFRLPKAIVKHEVAQIAELGVKFELNHPIADLEKHMKKKGFDAVFMATGAGTPHFLGVPGENLNGVYSANAFLVRVNLMKAIKFPSYDTPMPDVIGKNVVVFGGGNVAMDAARCAKRLGAKDVTIMYRRSEEEIPARHEEFIEAQKEGINFKYLTTPYELAGENGHLTKIKYYNNKLGEPDSSGRRRPVAITEEPKEKEADFAVVAIGQGPNSAMDLSCYECDRKGRLIVNPETFEVKKGIFAGGDIVSGTGGTVIYAAGCGLTAAKAINECLKN